MECVVLLHGLARTPRSFNTIEKELIASGYSVVNQGYPSRQFGIATLANKSLPKALAKCPQNAKKIHFVTHSLSGILLRQYLSITTIEKLGHTVMLGPPNQGSEVVDKLKGWRFFQAINGPAGTQLGTDAQAIPMQLPSANFKVGIIAGRRSINWILSTMIPGKDDGKVSVERTKLVGMTDHLVMSVTHPMMMRNKQVIKQVKAFLKQGKFLR